MRCRILVIMLALGSARPLHALQNADVQLTPTLPEPPSSATDSIISLALEQAVVHGMPPDLSRTRPRVLIIRDDAPVSARALPRIDSVAFSILDSAQIQALADRHESMDYLVVSGASIHGDSGTVGIGDHVAQRPHSGRGTRQFSTRRVCYWILRRHEGVWRIEREGGCVVW